VRAVFHKQERILINGEPLPQKAQWRSNKRWLASILIGLIVMVSLSCAGSGLSIAQLDATMVAVRVQQTYLADTSVAITLRAATLATTPAPNKPTLAPPLSTPQPAIAATAMPVAGLATVPAPAEPDERTMKSAKILLFENMSASRYTRIVKKALDDAGYFYVDVGSAQGWFKSELLASEDWDLVIASAERDVVFGGELLSFIDDRVAQGAGAIVESYSLGLAPLGKARSLLDRCGVNVQADWVTPDLPVFFWLVPDHPVFHQPNEIPGTLKNNAGLGPGDMGDLLAAQSVDGVVPTDTVMLAGTNPRWKDDHALLVSCVGGRVILQTFRSHDYNQDDMVDLWQNYIYQTLKNHFALTKNSPPTPAATVLPSSTDSAVLDSQTPGPEYILGHDCGGLMAARLLDAPLYQKDLFEHHASGEFVLLNLELINRSNFPIQIWANDYALEGTVGGQQVQVGIHKAATGYLYIQKHENLWQDLIQPGPPWHTQLAFDIDPAGKDWTLVVRPGSQFNEQVCEVRIPLVR
jgi:hypothetical protein